MKNKEVEVCEACGTTAEFGYTIKEGDDVADVTIYAENKEFAESEFNTYFSLAKKINKNVTHNINFDTETNFNPLNAKFKFECSAEKIIFELKSRSLAK